MTYKYEPMLTALHEGRQCDLKFYQEIGNYSDPRSAKSVLDDWVTRGVVQKMNGPCGPIYTGSPELRALPSASSWWEYEKERAQIRAHAAKIKQLNEAVVTQ